MLSLSIGEAGIVVDGAELGSEVLMVVGTGV